MQLSKKEIQKFQEEILGWYEKSLDHKKKKINKSPIHNKKDSQANEPKFMNNYNIIKGDMYLNVENQINFKKNNFISNLSSKIDNSKKDYFFPIFQEKDCNPTVEELNWKLETLMDLLKDKTIESKKNST